MNACAPILLDSDRLAAALARFPRDWPMWIDGREFAGEGGTIERLSPAHGALVSRTPRGGAADVDRAIAAARRAFDEAAGPT
ncbi:MAG: aldehyde dehydrogenase family protein [Roseiarcus sp.]